MKFMATISLEKNIMTTMKILLKNELLKFCSLIGKEII